MPYPTICATTTSFLAPRDFSQLEHIMRRIAFARLRLFETKYGKWEHWAKEAFAWFLERWDYLLLEQIVSHQARGRVLIGCVVQKKRFPDELLHFEELTDLNLPVGSIHISRFAGAGIEKLHLFRFFLALYDYAKDNRAKTIYAVMRSGLLEEIWHLFPGDELVVRIPGRHYHRGGYVFYPVQISLIHFEKFAELLRDPFGLPEKRFRMLVGGSRRLKRVIDAASER